MGYDQIKTFTFDAVRRYNHGAYVGSRVRMVFNPLPNVDSKAICYVAKVNNSDGELDGLRDFISRIIAGQMLVRLRNGETVEWTPRLSFCPKGLSILPAGISKFWGSSREILFNDLEKYEFKDGIFCLAIRGEKGWVAKEEVSGENFFPGFALFSLLIGQHDAILGVNSKVAKCPTS